MGYHAKLSPSSAHRWTDCTGSINAQEGIPNQNSEASMNGTCGHQMGAECLENPMLDPVDYLGRVMMFWAHAAAQTNGEDWKEAFVAESEDDLGLPVIDHIPPIQEYELLGETMRDSGEFTGIVTVSEDLVDAVSTYVDFIRQRAELFGAEMHVEKRVPIGHFTGEPDATGTSDAILIYRNDDGENTYTIESDDAKFGRHKVHAYETLVPARGETPPEQRMNLQIACYVLGALEKYGAGRKITRCKGLIIQPFLNHVSEYECSVEELLELRDSFLAVKAEETRTKPVFKPSYDNCHFCKARNPTDESKRCKARDEAVIHLVLDGFGDAGEPIIKEPPPVSQLGALYGALDFVRQWCDDIQIRVKSELTAGRQVMRPDGLRYILVQGRKGDREWDDVGEVEKMLKHMRLKIEEMYSMRVIGPSVVEKMSKKGRKSDAPPPRINAQQWKKLQARITQSEGKMSVALETDTRPELPSSAEGFVDVVGGDDCSDLLS